MNFLVDSFILHDVPYKLLLVSTSMYLCSFGIPASHTKFG